jgi:hypothetical protein
MYVETGRASSLPVLYGAGLSAASMKASQGRCGGDRPIIPDPPRKSGEGNSETLFPRQDLIVKRRSILLV